MSVGQEFWIVAVGCSNPDEDPKTAQHRLSGCNPQQAKEKSATDQKGDYKKELERGLGAGVVSSFEVPDGDKSLRHESFDNLIKLTDDLAKYDNQVESVAHRLERQLIELDPKEAKFQIHTRVRSGGSAPQQTQRDLTDYLRSWQWDEAKYPRSLNISQLAEQLMKTVAQNDDEARKKLSDFNDKKTQLNNLSKKDVPLLSKELIDVLTPSVVKMKDGKSHGDDFIYTDYLTSLVVILTRGQEVEFLNNYESFQAGKDNKFVLPRSAMQFNIPDKEGHTIWRIVMTRANVEDFKKSCRERKYVARDFEFSAEGFSKLEETRKSLQAEVGQKSSLTKQALAAIWSDTMVAWMHVKAMRVFVETVLRCAYVGGNPLYFASYLICPTAKTAPKMRKALESFSKGKPGSTPAFLGEATGEGEEGDEFFPYVSMSFTPFTVPREAKA